MKAKVVKERKKNKIKIKLKLTRSQTEANFSKGNSLLGIAMFCKLSNGVKNPFTARMLSYEVLNLFK